jgi:hypothetical protein
MKRLPFLLVALTATALASAQTPSPTAAPAVKYGANAGAGRTFVRDGVRLYFEVYGAGEPRQPRFLD